VHLSVSTEVKQLINAGGVYYKFYGITVCDVRFFVRHRPESSSWSYKGEANDSQSTDAVGTSTARPGLFNNVKWSIFTPRALRS